MASHDVARALCAPYNDTLAWDHSMPRSKPIPDDSRRGAQGSAALLIPLLVAGFSLPGCSTEPADLQANLYPEDQQPYFKTCLARHDGTYHERALQQHRFIDIYEEPAPDQGPITDDCIVRE